MRAVYLDASALVKLAVEETESPSLQSYLHDQPELVTSELATVEVARAAFRATGEERARQLGEVACDQCTQVRFDEPLRTAAARCGPPELGALDAVHLASALRLRHVLDTFVTYDLRLAAAASDAGLTVVSPGRVG